MMLNKVCLVLVVMMISVFVVCKLGVKFDDKVNNVGVVSM